MASTSTTPSNDRFRNTGPDPTIAWRSLTPSATITKDTTPRKRTRAPEDGRKIFAQTGVVSRARGSAYMECGRTKVMVGCYGPRDLLKTREYSAVGKLQCELKVTPYGSETRRGHLLDQDEKDAAMVIEEALSTSVLLEKYPKSLIDIFITILEDDGSAIAAAISCASLALADGGIEMSGLIASATVAVTDGVAVVDPTHAEEGTATPTMTLAYIPSFDEVCALVQRGTMDSGTQEQAIQLAVQRCTQVHAVQESCLLRAASSANGTAPPSPT
eukprot:m.208943 g.208943  ORF g.208943 m.208943 type:complete len:273 (+) comp24320_c0_seq1:50-868(+)